MRGTVVVNCATGVLARYYHRFARFLAGHGFTVLTYDYSGIGLSRPPRMRDADATWRLWGERDFDAVLGHVAATRLPQPLTVIGHSIGGVVIGYAPRAATIDRILTVGAQHAYWRDYAAGERTRLFARWHLLMPALTAACGYFPGKRLGWLEDLPKGVANDWAFMGAALDAREASAHRPEIRSRFASVCAPILALSMTDDPYGTPAALGRALAYFSGSERTIAMLAPGVLGETAVGHFAPFHDRLRETLWPGLVSWIADGRAVWPVRSVADGESAAAPRD